ncbi:MAG: flavin reductase family protein, partial [Dehalococcoidia bacterium]|nr:flavin reductase family protein [Dehalococcoidia bacterium]
FAVNVLADNQLDLAGRFGSVHGFEVDKFKQFGIKTRDGSKIGAPLILGCYASIECRVKTAMWDVASNRAIYLAEPIAYTVDEGLRPMVWLSHRFFKVGAQCSL